MQALAQKVVARLEGVVGQIEREAQAQAAQADEEAIAAASEQDHLAVEREELEQQVQALESKLAHRKKRSREMRQEVQSMTDKLREAEDMYKECKSSTKSRQGDADPASDSPNPQVKKQRKELSQVIEKAIQLERQAELLQLNGARAVPESRDAALAAKLEMESALQELEGLSGNVQAELEACSQRIAEASAFLEGVVRSCCKYFDRASPDLEALKTWIRNVTESDDVRAQVPPAVLSRLENLGVLPKAR
jgi:chromosome segregation ATPase